MKGRAQKWENNRFMMQANKYSIHSKFKTKNTFGYALQIFKLPHARQSGNVGAIGDVLNVTTKALRKNVESRTRRGTRNHEVTRSEYDLVHLHAQKLSFDAFI